MCPSATIKDMQISSPESRDFERAWDWYDMILKSALAKQKTRLSLDAFLVLRRVAGEKDDRIKMKRIRAQAAMSRDKAAKIVRRLRRFAFVKCELEYGNRKDKVLVLTPRGKRLLDGIQDEIDSQIKQLSVPDTQRFRDALETIQCTLPVARLGAQCLMGVS